MLLYQKRPHRPASRRFRTGRVPSDSSSARSGSSACKSGRCWHSLDVHGPTRSRPPIVPLRTRSATICSDAPPARASAGLPHGTSTRRKRRSCRAAPSSASKAYRRPTFARRFRRRRSRSTGSRVEAARRVRRCRTWSTGIRGRRRQRRGAGSASSAAPSRPGCRTRFARRRRCTADTRPSFVSTPRNFARRGQPAPPSTIASASRSEKRPTPVGG